MAPHSPHDDVSPHDDTLQALAAELAEIRTELIAHASAYQERIDTANPDFRASACNLLHYLALRRRDLRPLQHRLAALGLSSLGRAEAHVLPTVDAVLRTLRTLTGSTWAPPIGDCAVADVEHGKRLLADHTKRLLGPDPTHRGSRIMVTMPSDAADDPALLHDLVAQGIDCIHINCAHDDADTWARIIEHLRRAETALDRQCRVVMDLGGPKLRTGPLDAGPPVAKVKPSRDAYGHVTAPGRIWLTDEDAPQAPRTPAQACLFLPREWLAAVSSGTRIDLLDARDARRTLVVVEAATDGCWAETDKTVYFVPGMTLRAKQGGAKKAHKAKISGLHPVDRFIRLWRNDVLVLTRDLQPGHPAEYDSAGALVTPATIACTIPEIFDDIRAGESIWFDDGKIGGTITLVEQDRAHIRITDARDAGEKLRADKGINLPDSTLHLPALTDKDIEDLAFVVRHADIVELSFPNDAADVAALQEHLERLGGRQPALVLKIETRRGFEHLPDMLLTALRSRCCGVMIARGDLAVECGFERLAEVQEEILWICEAAHVPVIWATQVLESLAKTGKPSRAEITDAAMADRAECVMLNKGPHIVDAVRVLDDILWRMQAHQAKKQSMLRSLHLAHGLSGDAPVQQEDE